MVKIDLEIHEGVIDIIEKIKAAHDLEIQLWIPEGSVLFENILNLKLLKKETELIGRSLEFITEDEIGQTMISMVENGGPEGIPGDFISKEVSIGGLAKQKIGSIKKKSFSFPPLFGFIKKIRLPRIRLKPLLLILVAGGVIAGGLYFTAFRMPKADIEIVVNSLPLTKSVSVKVKGGVKSDSAKRILGGSFVETTISDSLEGVTTGTKTVGEKAKGKVKIFNKTTAEKEFKKGTELKSSDDDDLVYVLDDTVIVPARTDQDPVNPGDAPTMTPGEVAADVLAKDIGSKYNLKAGSSLEFDDFETSQFIASVIQKIDGGSSETVKVVTQEDIKKVGDELYAGLVQKAPSGLGAGAGQKKIAGSETVTLTIQEANAIVGEEKDKVKVTQTVVVKGLVYSEKDLDKLLSEMIKDLVPDGYEIFSEEREVKVEVLGNTDSAVLTSTEADLQVTLKTYMVPKIDEGKLKEDLRGVSVSEAQKILGSVKSIKTFKIDISSRIPFFQRMPRDTEDISLKIIRE